MSIGPVIAIKGFSKYYGSFVAAKNVSFEVRPGEVIGFVGLNGAGKSTTINTMLGFLRASEGEVRLFGKRVAPERAHLTHKHLGFASGDMSLFENLTGKQYFSFMLSQQGIKDTSRLEELRDMFKPEDTKKIGDLSRGNKQKIALIGAFMARPKLVILDEPSSGLDPLMQQVFVDLVREEAARGTTIFMSSHYLNEVTDVSTRILLIKKGEIIKDLATAELVRQGGKLVRVVSKHPLKLPSHVDVLKLEDRDNESETVFIYKGSTKVLQAWLTSVPALLDFEVKDHDQEAAFEDLYSLETEEKDA